MLLCLWGIPFNVSGAGLPSLDSERTARADSTTTEARNDKREKNITGVVVAASDGEPLIGAQVRLEGTKMTAITNIDGSFKFNMTPQRGQRLTVTYIGMKQTTVAAGSNVRIVMDADEQLLGDVVVNGFFTRKKQTFTGAARSMTATKSFRYRQTTSCRLWPR